MASDDIPLHPVVRPLTRRRGAFEFAGKWLEKVKRLPESGMGYSVIGVLLEDGRSFDQVLIDSGIVSRVRGLPDIPFTEDDIVELFVTHKKWDWKEEP